MNCNLCREESGAGVLCDACAKEYFVRTCPRCDASIIQLRGPVFTDCFVCRDRQTVGPLPEATLAEIDALIASDAKLEAYRRLMQSTRCSLSHAVRFVEERRESGVTS